MLEGLSFGWRTAVLTVAVAQLLILATALTRTIANRTANRTLATLLVVLAGQVMPWLIGFSGFYDKWMWLTFAPFQITLAVAPLGWLYVVNLAAGALLAKRVPVFSLARAIVSSISCDGPRRRIALGTLALT